MTNKDLKKYVVAAKNGSQEGFTKLFELMQKKAYFTALKIVKDEQAAEDMVQEAFINAFTSLNSLQDNSKFESWFLTVLSNKCKRYLQKKRPDSFSQYENDDFDESFEDTLENKDISLLPHEVTDNQALKDIVMARIEQLPDEQRACVVMFYYDELPIKDIAIALDIPQGTVKSRLNKARKTLKADFEEIEKKEKIKLHGVPFLPFMRWVFLAASESASVPTAVSTGISSTVISTLVDAGVITGTATGIVGIPVIVKVIAIVLVVATGVTGAVFGIRAIVNLFKEDGLEESTTAIVETTTSENENDNAERIFNNSSSPLAVYNDNKTKLYYISQNGIIMVDVNSGEQQTVTKDCPENLVFYNDCLLYLYDGTLYSYNDISGELSEIMETEGVYLYEQDGRFASVNKSGTTAYSIVLQESSCNRILSNVSHILFKDGNFFYDDNNENVCSSSMDGTAKDSVLISASDTKGFKTGYCVDNGSIYYADFNTDENGIIHKKTVTEGSSMDIPLDSSGVLDFSVVKGYIFYAPYDGGLYCYGNSTPLSKDSFYSIGSTESYSIWVNEANKDVYLVTPDSPLKRIDVPNTVTDIDVVGNTVYYRTPNGFGVCKLN